MKINNTKELEKIANNIRIDILNQVYIAKSGHPGGALSIADILAVLYFNEMNINAKAYKMINRDRLILSKGHAVAALYAVLAERGFFEKEELNTFRKLGSRLQGHPDMERLPGIDISTGSLGQGLSVANGMAIAAKMDKLDSRIYCILGDGEIEEGQIWEAAMTSSKYKLDNLCVILDYNGLQIDGKITEVKGLNNIEDKFKSFGFNVISCDGNNIEQLIQSFNKAKSEKEKPSIIIAKTVKGKGIPFMENKAEWHGKAPNDNEFIEGMNALLKRKENL